MNGNGNKTYDWCSRGKDFSIKSTLWSKKFKNRKAKLNRLKNKMRNSNRSDSICYRNIKDCNNRDQKSYKKEICSSNVCIKYKNCSSYKDNTRINCADWKVKRNRSMLNNRRQNISNRIRWVAGMRKICIIYRKHKLKKRKSITSNKRYSLKSKKRSKKMIMLITIYDLIIKRYIYHQKASLSSSLINQMT